VKGNNTVKTLRTDVCVIGGGSTGAGVVRDVVMRGFSAVLVDRADIAQGTSGRFHGLLHSGARYIASDPESATECAEENEIVKRINANAIEATGGLFVVTAHDDEEYADQFLARAAAAQVPAEEISIAEALRREPRLDPRIKRAFAVQDGTVDGWQMTWGAIRSAQAYGAQILTYHRVTTIERDGDRICAVIVHDERGGEDIRIECGFVLNCGGPWAGTIAGMADCHGVDVVAGAGIMIAMNHRLTHSVINRCVWPADGDILVPDHTVCIIGTTDLKSDDADNLPIPADQVQQMLDSGEAMIPGFRKARAVHAWAGAPPPTPDPPEAKEARLYTIGHRLDNVESRNDGPTHEQIICECEMATRAMLENVMDTLPKGQLDDVRRQMRLGMGPCQGGFCSQRAAGIAHERGDIDSTRANGLLRLFLKNRWIGLWPILYGKQARQAVLDAWIHEGTLDVEHLPAAKEEVVR